MIYNTDLEELLEYSFKDKELFIKALTHKSYKKDKNNERLEFLGDAVLDLIIGEYLYKKFPTENEGVLSKIRSSLVDEKGFTKLAKFIKLGDYLIISLSEENNNGRVKPSLLSNTFEAIIGAIYLESGLEITMKIVIKLLEKNYTNFSLDSLSKDFKTSLQEFTQAEFGTIPNYKVLSTNGPDHNKEFKIAIYLDNKIISQALGSTKKDAQQKAAEIALKNLKKIDL